MPASDDTSWVGRGGHCLGNRLESVMHFSFSQTFADDFFPDLLSLRVTLHLANARHTIEVIAYTVLVSGKSLIRGGCTRSYQGCMKDYEVNPSGDPLVRRLPDGGNVVVWF